MNFVPPSSSHIHLGSLLLGVISAPDFMVEPILTAGRDFHRWRDCFDSDNNGGSHRGHWCCYFIRVVQSSEYSFPALLSSESRVGFDVSGWSSMSIKMMDKWFIQSYARIFAKAQPYETTLQWSDPRWMSGARRNEIHLARVRLILL